MITEAQKKAIYNIERKLGTKFSGKTKLDAIRFISSYMEESLKIDSKNINIVDKGINTGENNFTPLMLKIMKLLNVEWNGVTDSVEFYDQIVDEIYDDRKMSLYYILRPIKYSWSSSIESRRSYVSKRYSETSLIKPFLYNDELELVNMWNSENDLSDLFE